jgi:hypothetical protein
MFKTIGRASCAATFLYERPQVLKHLALIVRHKLVVYFDQIKGFLTQVYTLAMSEAMSEKSPVPSRESNEVDTSYVELAEHGFVQPKQPETSPLETPETREAAIADVRERLTQKAETTTTRTPEAPATTDTREALQIREAKLRRQESAHAYERGQLLTAGYGLSAVAVAGGLSAAIFEGMSAVSALGLDGVVSSLVSTGMTDSAAAAFALASVPAAALATLTTVGWAGMKLYHSAQERRARNKK